MRKEYCRNQYYGEVRLNKLAIFVEPEPKFGRGLKLLIGWPEYWLLLNDSSFISHRAERRPTITLKITFDFVSLPSSVL